jgi:4-phosphopantoate--beta-alanine ligase
VNIPKTHPRYHSLLTREKIAEGVKKGITSEIGLIAHGRGEAFDYLLGEKTTSSARRAERAAAAALLLASHPVISVNGNTAALLPEEIIALSKTTGAGIEANIFYYSKQRRRNIIKHLQRHGAVKLYTNTDARIPHLPHARAVVDSQGIYRADVVLVPLEDGDRCAALKNMGKTVIAIDLNPLSRTAKTADITIVDNITRAIPNMTAIAAELKNNTASELRRIVSEYENKQTLREALEEIITYLKSQLCSQD